MSSSDHAGHEARSFPPVDHGPGAGIMEADDPSSDDSFHSPTFVTPSALDKLSIIKVLPSSANVQSHLTPSFADNGNSS